MRKAEPCYFEQVSVSDRLVDVAFMVATSNYRLGKWLQELEPTTTAASQKPSRTEGTIEDVLAELQYSLSRMSVLSALLGPHLRNIMKDSKRFSLNGVPTTPSFRNPAKLAQKRGIKDLEELQGMVGHLETIIQETQTLTFSRVKKSSSQVKAAVHQVIPTSFLQP